jgi:cytidylate kinase
VLDTGAMYRAITQAMLVGGLDPADADAAAKVADAATIVLEHGVTTLNGADVSAAIRGPEVTRAVSTVAAHPAVRAVLVARQRDWVDGHGGGVVEGRDIGTVVFPHATVKVYLTARDDERARRRQRDEHAAAREVGVAEVQADLERRDAIDSNRAISPLQAAADAVVIDTTMRDVDTVVGDIVARVRAVKDS